MKLRGLTLAFKGISYPLKGLNIARHYVFGSDKPPQFKPSLSGFVVANQPLSLTGRIETQVIKTQLIAASTSNFTLTVNKEPIFTLEADKPSDVKWSDN